MNKPFSLEDIHEAVIFGSEIAFGSTTEYYNQIENLCESLLEDSVGIPKYSEQTLAKAVSFGLELFRYPQRKRVVTYDDTFEFLTNLCGKCEMLGDCAPCDECSKNPYK